jgi:hypothetical protein
MRGPPHSEDHPGRLDLAHTPSDLFRYVLNIDRLQSCAFAAEHRISDTPRGPYLPTQPCHRASPLRGDLVGDRPAVATREPGHHAHLREGGRRSATDIEPAMAGRRAMTGLRSALERYLNMRQGLTVNTSCMMRGLRPRLGSSSNRMRGADISARRWRPSAVRLLKVYPPFARFVHASVETVSVPLPVGASPRRDRGR